ncbi:unnamed protein product [Paramecium octaurelia]|uniref:cDENN domain-containing protein n=1 Tax=Paramecium octaurelia TaxID=43137 RepID=A0A8S1X0S8_PAROT|nr:unnamed protein product [Paramecium octaurelia]
MQTLDDENKELRQQLESLEKTYKILTEELQIFRENMKQYDKEKQILMEEKIKLQQESKEKKSTEFEKKIKSIIEKLPCQIEINSLRQISQSTIQKAKDAIKNVAIAYKDAYNQDYHKRLSDKPQSLFESLYIVGGKHKESEKNQEYQQQQDGQLKSKIFYKCYKYDISAKERNFLESIESDIEGTLESLLEVEKLDYDNKKVEDRIFNLVNEKNIMDNQFFFINKRGFFDHQSDKFVPSNMELITEINNDKQLFLIFLGVDDFITSFKQDRFKFWKFKKYYCLVTYFPIFEIFEQVLQFVDNIIQTQRKGFQQQLQNQLKLGQREKILEIKFKQKIYQDYDSLNIIQASKEAISSYLCDLSKKYLSSNQPNLDFKFISNLTTQNNQVLKQHLTYSVTKDIRITNMLKAAHVVMQIFCNQLNDFFLILTEILKEEQIVFCSENKSILVQVCYFFHKIIYPFIYTQPVKYYTDMDTFQEISNQERPFIFGINKSFNEFRGDLSQQNCPTIVELSNMKATIHQFTPIDPNQIKQLFPDDEFQDIFNNYTKDPLNLQIKKCQILLSRIKMKIENDVLKQMELSQDPKFVSDGELNQGIIIDCTNKKLSENKNRTLLMDIFRTTYFQTYLKHQQKCKF